MESGQAMPINELRRIGSPACFQASQCARAWKLVPGWGMSGPDSGAFESKSGKAAGQMDCNCCLTPLPVRVGLCERQTLHTQPLCSQGYRAVRQELVAVALVERRS